MMAAELTLKTMNTQNKKIVPERLRPRTLARALTACAAAVLGLALPRLTSASENVPHLPYAPWADVPAPTPRAICQAAQEIILCELSYPTTTRMP